MLSSWLHLLCEMLPGVRVALALNANDSLEQVVWPPDSGTDQKLLDVAQLALRQQTPVVVSREQGLMFARLINNGAVVVAVWLDADPKQRAAIEQLLDWGGAWYQFVASDEPSFDQALAEVAYGLAGQPLAVICQQICDRLRQNLGVKRVSLVAGLHQEADLVSCSDSPGIDQKVGQTKLITHIALEALTEEHPWQLHTAASANPSAKLLLGESSQDTLLALPFVSADFSLVLQIQSTNQISESATEKLISLGNLLTSLIAAEYRQQRPFSTIAVGLKSLLKQQARTGLIIAAVSGLFVAALLLLEGDYEVTARATIEGLSQRAVVAPYDGYVVAANARAGDEVASGFGLAALDDSELQLDLQRVENERLEAHGQYRQALAAGSRSESGILKARLDQVLAKVESIQRKLTQATIEAPIDGVLIKGDMSRMIGAPVSKGDVLFEIAPLNAYRVIVHVNESDIDDIRTQQSGRVTLTSHPATPLPFVVEGITSVVDSEKDLGIVFQTEGELTDHFDFVRPGMEGYARISVGPRSYAWILFHNAIDWWRLLIWKLTP